MMFASEYELGTKIMQKETGDIFVAVEDGSYAVWESERWGDTHTFVDSGLFAIVEPPSTHHDADEFVVVQLDRYKELIEIEKKYKKLVARDLEVRRQPMWEETY